LFSVGAAYNEGLTTPPKGQINGGERTKNGKLGQTETEMPSTAFPHRSFFTKTRKIQAVLFLKIDGRFSPRRSENKQREIFDANSAAAQGYLIYDLNFN